MILSSRLALLASTLAGALALGGCAPTLSPLPASTAVQPALEWRTEILGTAALEHSWWQRFGDARMVALVERARENNPDIRLAAARVEEARATEAVSRSLLLPTLEAGLVGGAQREVSAFGQGQNSFVAEPAFRASYEVDLFGKNRANIDAAQAGVAASEAAQEATLLSVSAATASSYVSLLALDTRRKVLSDTLKLRGQALKFARDRAEVGYTSQLEWRQAQAEYQATAQLVPQIEAQIARQENALSVLTGEMPGDIIRGGALADLQQPAAPDVIPSQLLRLRPDIAVAEYQLAASDAQMRAARARFMPTLGLSASAGRIQGQFDAATARRDQAVFAYRSTVLNAFREVEDRLAVVARLDDQQRALEAQRAAVADALRHARNRYRAGYTPYIEQVDAQRSLLGVELSLVQLEADQITAMIGLYQAVGGAPDTDAIVN